MVERYLNESSSSEAEDGCEEGPDTCMTPLGNNTSIQFDNTPAAFNNKLRSTIFSDLEKK